MTKAESDKILAVVKSLTDKITKYTEEARLDSLLSCYDDSPGFLAFSSDGTMRNADEFRKICAEYYNNLKKQKVSTISEKFNVIDTNLVIFGWTGNIVAEFKNGDTMIMNNYSVTNVFRKMNGKWKIVHDHESALPPEIIHEGR